MRKSILSIFLVTAACLCLFARCAKVVVDCDYTVRMLSESERGGVKDTIETARLLVFYTDTLGWKVNSYEDAVNGIITHKDGRTKEADLKPEQVEEGIYEMNFTQAPVMFVAYHTELPAFGWRDANVEGNLPKMNITAVFQTHLFGTESNPLRETASVKGGGWTMVYAGSDKEPVDTGGPAAGTVTAAELPYGIGFESDEGNDKFQASSSYSSTLRYDGADNFKWGLFYSAVSTANNISGSQSLSMRWTTSNSGEWARASTNFTVEGLKQVTFNAKYAYEAEKESSMNVKVLRSTDNGATWDAGEVFTLTETARKYTYNVSDSGLDARIRFTVSVPDPKPEQTAYVIIDDVVFE